jgi:hypothetical protein
MTDFRTYYAANKERICERVRLWQAANPDKVRAYTAKNAEASRGQRKEHYQTNRALVIARVGAHYDKNSGRMLIKRRVWAGEVQKEAIPPWLTEEQEKAIQWFYDEARRLTKETGVTHVVDHIDALFRPHSCGLHVPWNLQVLTDAENKRKRWRDRRVGL